MKKYLVTILITVAMIAVLLVCVHFNSADSTISFLINGTDTVKIYSDEDNGIAYVFLPSYTVMENTVISIPDTMSIYIDGIPIISGTDCSAFQLNREYKLEINGSPLKTIVFLQSANVATMFVNTISGNMNKVHRDKSYREYVDVALYAPDGELDYKGDSADKIRGHGNITTWDLDKKSYNLYMRNAESLLSMAEGEKYILLANRTDNTNLRNKIILDFARKIEGFDGFSPNCEFVDLYLNNEYYGLYLLCGSTKNAISQFGRKEIRYSWDTELTKRARNLKNAFEVSTGISVEVKFPEKVNADGMNYIEGLLAEMQSAIENPEGVNTDTGKYWFEYIDIDSWARKYLIEEIFMNYDAVAISQYYFLRKTDDKIYAGPCWDYDNSLGLYTHTNSNCFLAQRLWKNEDTCTPWYHFLWKQPEFRNYVIELYNYEFLPELQRLSDTVIPYELRQIQAALYNNSLRWNIENADRSVEMMSDFLDSRIAFLNSAWVDRVDYKTITLTGIEEYRFFCTPAGTVCDNLPTPEDLGVHGVTAWTYQDSGEIFDENTVIKEDITLYVYDAGAGDEEERTPTSVKITIMSLFLFSGMVVFACISEQRMRGR